MARKPTEAPASAPALPAKGGAYEFVDGQLRPVSQPDDAAETAPVTPSETGA